MDLDPVGDDHQWPSVMTSMGGEPIAAHRYTAPDGPFQNSSKPVVSPSDMHLRELLGRIRELVAIIDACGPPKLDNVRALRAGWVREGTDPQSPGRRNLRSHVCDIDAPGRGLTASQLRSGRISQDDEEPCGNARWPNHD